MICTSSSCDVCFTQLKDDASLLLMVCTSGQRPQPSSVACCTASKKMEAAEDVERRGIEGLLSKQCFASSIVLHVLVDIMKMR